MNWGNLLRKLASLIGSEIRDDETGECLGKALLFAFGGRLWIIGYTGKKALRPVPVLKKEIRYWIQELRFRAPEDPDYPRLRGRNE